jgi:cytochrome b involved in lipid metabolism
MKLLAPFALLLPAGMLVTNQVATPQDIDLSPSFSYTISTPTTPLPTFTLSEVSRHQSPDDCWLVVSGQVYDLTTFTPINSAEEKMMERCGQDVSSSVTTPPPTTLPRYQIGTLIP